MGDALYTLAIIIAFVFLSQQGIRWNARRVARKRYLRGIEMAVEEGAAEQPPPHWFGLANMLLRIRESAR